MIAIVDYGMGNVRSLFNSLTYLGVEAQITSDPKELFKASHVILPGVGAFGKAMVNLKKQNLLGPLKEVVIEQRKPFLGICLGLQLLAKESIEHGQNGGLGWLDATVVKLEVSDSKMKLPHMGWNTIEVQSSSHSHSLSQSQCEHPLFANLSPSQRCFYFVHSFRMLCNDAKDIAATCDYGVNFPAVVIRDNIVATQFHPEKSQDNGIQLLGNFVNWGFSLC